MSAGNLYRYFPRRKRSSRASARSIRRSEPRAFAELMAQSGNIMEALCAGLREHVLSRPAEKARMIVEIWAEAGRNPRVAEITRAIDNDVLGGLERLMDAAKAAGAASPALEPRFGARFFFTFVAGLFKRIAIEPDLDRDAETAMAVGVLRALFAGALEPDRAASCREA